MDFSSSWNREEAEFNMSGGWIGFQFIKKTEQSWEVQKRKKNIFRSGCMFALRFEQFFCKWHFGVHERDYRTLLFNFSKLRRFCLQKSFQLFETISRRSFSVARHLHLLIWCFRQSLIPALTIINGIRRREGVNAGCLHGNPAFLNLSMDLHNDKSGKAHFCHAMFAQIFWLES